ncbi:uncharacterized protein [Triticum aestivum]|uniref:uncharacterized protein n=1 Tax=Triticum aestivum TaxID=4565 RepID=UPI001D028DE6|nr:uncharacterized protein LOC123131530 [Triticum aestivum]
MALARRKVCGTPTPTLMALPQMIALLLLLSRLASPAHPTIELGFPVRRGPVLLSWSDGGGVVRSSTSNVLFCRGPSHAGLGHSDQVLCTGGRRRLEPKRTSQETQPWSGAACRRLTAPWLGTRQRWRGCARWRSGLEGEVARERLLEALADARMSSSAAIISAMLAGKSKCDENQRSAKPSDISQNQDGVTSSATAVGTHRLFRAQYALNKPPYTH